MSSEQPYTQSEHDRRLANLIRLGTVEAADYAAARLRVRSGQQVTDWLPWLTLRAHGDIDWFAPKVGEQVVVVSPSGDPAQGVVAGALYQRAYPAPADRPTLHRVVYQDGTVMDYDSEAQHWHLTCVGDVTMEAAANVRVEAAGDVQVEAAGEVRVQAPLIRLN